MPIEPTTAVLFFATAPTSRSKWTKFSNKRGYGKLAHAVHKHTLETIEASGLDLVISNGQSQKGNNFGERLSHAIADTFALGYHRVIVIGNDCPHLIVSDLIRAADTNYQPVLGPSADGGVYLVAFNKDEFNPSEFQSVFRDKKTVFKGLEKILGTACTILESKIDIDDEASLREAMGDEIPGAEFLHILWAQFFMGFKFNPVLYPDSRPYFLKAFTPSILRGPPAMV